MNKLLAFLLLCSFASLSAAQTTNDSLSRKSCQKALHSFLLDARKSLTSYAEQQLPTAHRGGARNTRNFIATRKAWLEECDSFLKQEQHNGLLRNPNHTQQLLGAMQRVINELDVLVKTPMKKNEDKPSLTLVSKEAFDNLFIVMDKQLINLQKRGLI